MNYSENPSSVRVDFFRPSGKWYMTEALDMRDFWTSGPGNMGPADAVRAALERTERGRGLLESFIVVVIDPYHQYEYPVVLLPPKEGS